MPVKQIRMVAPRVKITTFCKTKLYSAVVRDLGSVQSQNVLFLLFRNKTVVLFLEMLLCFEIFNGVL